MSDNMQDHILERTSDKNPDYIFVGWDISWWDHSKVMSTFLFLHPCCASHNSRWLFQITSRALTAAELLQANTASSASLDPKSPNWCAGGLWSLSKAPDRWERFTPGVSIIYGWSNFSIFQLKPEIFSITSAKVPILIVPLLLKLDPWHPPAVWDVDPPFMWGISLRKYHATCVSLKDH